MKPTLVVVLVSFAAVGFYVACGSRAPTADDAGSGSRSPAENYNLNIEGAEVDVALGVPKSVVLKDGKTVRVVLKQKDVVVFQSDEFFFQHRREYTPGRKDLGGGIYQTMLATPQGSLIMVQEYSDLDPAMQVDPTLRAVTEDEVKLGYEYQEKPATMTLAGGKIMKGKQAVITQGETRRTYTVVACPDRSCRVLVVTKINDDMIEEEGHILDFFWSTLQVK